MQTSPPSGLPLCPRSPTLLPLCVSVSSMPSAELAQRVSLDSPTALVLQAGLTDSAQHAEKEAVSSHLTPTIFHEHWWLETVTGGRYQIVECSQGGRLIGWLPYVLSQRRGFRASVMPDMTYALGPAIDEGAGGSNKRWLRRLDTLQELAGKLPSVGFFSQTCHPGTPDVLGFQACGFDTAVQFSAEVSPAPKEAMWMAMRDKTRNVIRRAAERWEVTPIGEPQLFKRFYRDNLARNHDASYFDLETIAKVFEAAHPRQRCAMVMARNTAQQIAAAVFYVWDEHRMWYLLSSRAPALGENGAVSLLIWHAMQDAAQRGLVFDFHGVGAEGTARFYAGFGATLKPRFAVHRASPGFQLFNSVVTLLKGRSNRNHFTAP